MPLGPSLHTLSASHSAICPFIKLPKIFAMAIFAFTALSGIPEIYGAPKSSSHSGGNKTPGANHKTAQPTSKVNVQLFEQPCELKGPFDDKMLLATHQLGPGVISIRATTPESAREAILKIQKASGFPASLSLYRDHAIRYLEIQEKLLAALQVYFKSNNLEQLQAEVASSLSKRSARQFKRKSKTVHQQVFPSAEERKEAWIFLLREIGGRDPQETFHSITQNLNINYQCHLENQ